MWETFKFGTLWRRVDTGAEKGQPRVRAAGSGGPVDTRRRERCARSASDNQGSRYAACRPDCCTALRPSAILPSAGKKCGVYGGCGAACVSSCCTSPPLLLLPLSPAQHPEATDRPPPIMYLAITHNVPVTRCLSALPAGTPSVVHNQSLFDWHGLALVLAGGHACTVQG